MSLSSNKPVYKRVLLKLSGEAIKSDNEVIDFSLLQSIVDAIKKCLDNGVEVAVVIGAGNIWRGRHGSAQMNKNRADHMGMLATVINSLALHEVLVENNILSHVMTPPQVTGFAEAFDPFKADKYLSGGEVVIIGGGTGSPFFTTDTAAVLRAAEIGADAILMAKNIDGIYDSDPNKNPDAKKYDELTYKKILEDGLKAIDLTAAAFCLGSGITTFAFALSEPDNILKIIYGEEVGTKLCD